MYQHKEDVFDQKLRTKFEELRNNTYLSTSKGIPLPRLEVHHSGANKVVKGGGNLSAQPPKRAAQDISEFSRCARKRFFNYCNGLDLTNKNVYILVLTIQDFVCNQYLYLEAVRYVFKRFFKILTRLGFDYVYKVEYTGKEIPHIHMFLYCDKSKILFSDEESRLKVCNKISKIWCTLIFRNFIYFDRWLVYPDTVSQADLCKIYIDMRKNSCAYLQVPENLIKAINYFSNYTTKNKEYQNQIPLKFRGLRTWGYGRQNLKKISVPPVHIPITRNQFYKLHTMAKMRFELLMKEKNKKRKGKDVALKEKFTMHNGFFIPGKEDFYKIDIEDTIETLINDKDIIESEEELNKKILEEKKRLAKIYKRSITYLTKKDL